MIIWPIIKASLLETKTRDFWARVRFRSEQYWQWAGTREEMTDEVLDGKDHTIHPARFPRLPKLGWGALYFQAHLNQKWTKRNSQSFLKSWLLKNCSILDKAFICNIIIHIPFCDLTWIISMMSLSSFIQDTYNFTWITCYMKDPLKMRYKIMWPWGTMEMWSF